MLKIALMLTIGFGMAFAQSPTIPDDALKAKVRVAMMGDIIIIETPEGLDEVWLVCTQTPLLKPDGVHEYMALQSRNFTRSKIEGKEVTIVFDNLKNAPKRDSEGRLAAFVFYTEQRDEKSGPNTYLLNAELVRNGLARVDTTQGCSERNYMYELQRQAKSEHIGVWSVQ